MLEWCYCREEALGRYSLLAETRPSARSSARADVYTLARSGDAAKCVCVCVCVCVSLKLARSGDAAKCSLEQFPKICKLIRGLGFRV